MAFKLINQREPHYKSEPITEADTPEQLFNLLYNAGYRLTGSHKKAAELIEYTFKLYGRTGKIGKTEALRCLCKAFMETGTVNWNSITGCQAASENSSNELKIQKALLMLPPVERLMLVLRNILDLGYVEMARVTGVEKTDIQNTLTQARRSLRKKYDGLG